MKESVVRNKILDVSSRLFFDQGYTATGVNQIIEESGYSRMTLFHHFPKKRDILVAYLNEAEKLWFDGLDAVFAKIRDPRKKIMAIFDYRIQRQIKANFGGCQFIKVGAEVPQDDAEILKLVTHQKDRLRVLIEELVSQLKPTGRTMPDDVLVDTLYFLMEGSTVTASLYKDVEPLKKAQKIAASILT